MTDTPLPTEAPTATPEVAAFEKADCPFSLPAGQEEGQSVECGYLSVPEDRADPHSRTIRLAVAVFHPAGGPTLPDPIVYLEGGPGGSPLELQYLTFARLLEPVLAADRDVVTFDQRGVGLSKPALDCPAMTELTIELLDNEMDGKTLSQEEMAELALQVLQACAVKLKAEADLSDYHSMSSAADVNDLRLALGYEQVNLWGVSYGTRLALEILRTYPEAVRSAVLDSAYPPDVDLYAELPDNAARALDTLFQGCAADAACNTAYPDLRTVLFNTVEALNQRPAPFLVTDPLTGQEYSAVLDGNDLLSLIFQFLYETEFIPSLPKMIYDAQAGHFELVGLLFGAVLAVRDAVSDGMQVSVQCHEELPFSSTARFDAALARHPELAGLFQYGREGEMAYRMCEGWGAGQAPDSQNEPVNSDVPVLLLAGQYDPITPPSWARQAVKTLSNSFLFEFPGAGHSVSTLDCPRQMMLAFLDDPASAPDDTCLAAMQGPQWAVPAAGAVEFVPFRSEQFGIQGLSPKGWNEVSPGVYARQSSSLDVALLIEQAAAMSAADLLDLLLGQLGLAETPQSAGQHEAEGITWTLYELTVQGLPLDLALAESGTLALVALLQSDQAEHESLYREVFLPALDALKPYQP